jgi:hypothetical protein
MNIVSMREATGSAAKVSTAGIAIPKISRPSASSLQTSLRTIYIHKKEHRLLC